MATLTFPSGPQPIYQYVYECASEKVYNRNPSALVIGINGPQGSGKSYSVDQLVRFLAQQFPDLTTVAVSLDDIYLPFDQQEKLTQDAITSLDNNKLLQGRGLPGTHEVSLLTTLIENIQMQRRVKIPAYDKSAHNGKGDRVPERKWRRYDKVDILLVEGWFNGYQPIEQEELKLRYENADTNSALKKNKIHHVIQINSILEQYVDIWEKFDHFIVLETQDINNVYTWRIQQEHDLIAKKGTGMTDEEVKHFITRYMAMYELYYRDCCLKGCLSQPNRTLVVTIDLDRNILGSRIF